MRLTFLTPRLPPAVCGVGDHTAHMAAAMRELTAPITAIVLHPPRGRLEDTFHRVDQWTGRPEELQSLLCEHETDVLWVQYSAYGYGYQGLPQYLMRALESMQPRRKIAVYFHETHCAPRQLGWKGAILSALQKRLAKSLAQLADVIFTSNELYRQTIEHDYKVSTNRIHCLPLGSNIPVPMIIDRQRQQWRKELDWEDDDCVAVVFGSMGGQRKALQHSRETLLDALRAGNVHRIFAVGGENSVCGNDVLDGINPEIARATTVMGYRSPESVAKVLICADVALASYPYARLGKSGAFMSYAMAGLPVLLSEEPPRAGATFRGARLIGPPELPRLDAIARDIEARRQRQQQAIVDYSWPALAQSAIDVLNEVCPSAEKAAPVVGVPA